MDTETKFNDLLFKGLDHAIDSVSTGEDLIPFVLTNSVINRFPTPNLEQSKKEAEKYIATQLNEPFVVIAYEGYVTIEGNKSSAVFVRGINRVNQKEIILAQRYKSASSGKFEVIGNPVLISSE